MTDQKEEKGFVIKDKRIFGEESSAREESKTKSESAKDKDTQKKPEASESKKQGTKAPPLPEVNFSSFVFSLVSSALVHLGQVEDPVQKRVQKNLPLAKQTIDLLMILEEKTKGNLTQDEEKMLKAFLYDLRLKYVEANK